MTGALRDYGLVLGFLFAGMAAGGAATYVTRPSPGDYRVEDDPAFRQQGRTLRNTEEDLGRARVRVAELEGANAVLKINVERLMKVAVFPPAGPRGEFTPDDMIPPQNLPTTPEPSDGP
jgi:hypothetical protein